MKKFLQFIQGLTIKVNHDLLEQDSSMETKRSCRVTLAASFLF